MEALVALGVAANVLDVVNFSASIVSKSSELYKSTHGQLVEHTDIATTSSDLHRLTIRLSESIAPQGVQLTLSEDNQALYTLCKGCISVSQELQTGLNKLQVIGSPSKWKSLRKALKTIWTKEHVSELQSRLAIYREQLDSRILVGIKSQLDVVRLRQSEAFDGLDASIKALIHSLLDSSAKVELTIEQRAAITDASIEYRVQLAQNNIVNAVDDASKAHQQEIQSVEAQLTIIQASEDDNLTATQDSRDEIISSIECSTAVSSEEHERMTRQLKSAEDQIAALREEVKQTNANIAKLANQLTSSRAKPQDKKQQRLIEETNLLYKVLVAKDLMLQSLLDLVENIKSRLYNYTRAIASVNWKVNPYETARVAPNWPIKRTSEAEDLRIRLTESLFDAIDTGSIVRIQQIVDFRTVINASREVSITLHDLEPQIALFYSTLVSGRTNMQAREKSKYEEATKSNSTDVPWPYDPLSSPSGSKTELLGSGVFTEQDQFPSDSGSDVMEMPSFSNLDILSMELTSVRNKDPAKPDLDSNRRATSSRRTVEPIEHHTVDLKWPDKPHEGNIVNIEMTALTWTLFAWQKHDLLTMALILDFLVRSGADRKARDQTGLCAYDHARILKLGRDIIDDLNPFTSESGLLDAIRKGYYSDATTSLQNKAFAPKILDEMDQSPLALAIRLERYALIPKLLVAGFSPFAGFIEDDGYHPCMAYSAINGLLGEFSEPRLRDWLRSKDKTLPAALSIENTVEVALQVTSGTSVTKTPCEPFLRGDVLVFGVLFNDMDTVRACLGAIPPLHRVPINTIAWSMYAAIRRGSLDIVRTIIKYRSAWPTECMASQLDERHFLARWWLYPCRCPDGVHALSSRSLFDYTISLDSAPLCSSCKRLRPAYQRILDYIREEHEHVPVYVTRREAIT